MTDFSNIFNVLLKFINALAQFSEQVWDFITQDLTEYKLLAWLPAGTTFLTVLAVIGAPTVIIVLLVKLIRQ